jgi:hypothetical protein
MIPPSQEQFEEKIIEAMEASLSQMRHMDLIPEEAIGLWRAVSWYIVHDMEVPDPEDVRKSLIRNLKEMPT